jgi:hypothetical protein
MPEDRTMNPCRLMLIVVMLGAFALEGCGDDADDGGGVGGGGAAGAGGTGGSGGVGVGVGVGVGGGGGSGRGGTGGGQAATVMCGSSTCQSPAAAMGFITACCADVTTSTCGTSAMGGPCAEPVDGDPRCPGVDVMGFIMLPSCCTDGQCGIDASMFGMPGCIDLATAAERAAMMGMGAGIGVPAPQACGADADAGMEDDAGI